MVSDLHWPDYNFVLRCWVCSQLTCSKEGGLGLAGEGMSLVEQLVEVSRVGCT